MGNPDVVSAMKPETILQHLGEEEKPHGAIVPPLYQNTLFAFESMAEYEAAYDLSRQGTHLYTRVSNPTVEIVEKKLAQLEKTERAKLFSCGMSAMSAAIMSCVQAGDHVLAVDTCYGPTKQLLTEYLPKFGVTATFCEGSCPQAFCEKIQPNTKLIVVESPSSFLMKVQDLEAISREARARGISTVIDNSCATPLFQNPGDFGIDLIVHSVTKYLSGHSDVIAGAICTSKERMTRILNHELALLGGCISPFNAWLILRGMRTLSLRMQASQSAGNDFSRWLTEQPEVESVFHTGLPENPQRALIDKQMRGSGSLMAVVFKDGDRDRVHAFVNALDLFALGVSWGGFESLAVAADMHPIGWHEKRTVVRFYIGLEHLDDLKSDFRQAVQMSGLRC